MREPNFKVGDVVSVKRGHSDHGISGVVFSVDSVWTKIRVTITGDTAWNIGEETSFFDASLELALDGLERILEKL